MKNDRIHQLIEKYFSGLTSREEEMILEDYFSGNQTIEDDLIPLKNQFMLFKKGKEFSIDTTSLEARIISKIEDSETVPEIPSRKLNLSRLMIAASIALFITIASVIVFRFEHNELKDTYTDPQLAYLETQKTLLFISQKMNKSMQPLSNITKMNTGASQLKKLEKIDQSMGMLNLVSFINQSSNLKK
ncbi:MAG TPA: hypothetical protein VK179_02585 [Bacteroidales bacterium]|nr:hypothetical protein [Bacteroidales bacterium]